MVLHKWIWCDTCPALSWKSCNWGVLQSGSLWSQMVFHILCGTVVVQLFSDFHSGYWVVVWLSSPYKISSFVPHSSLAVIAFGRYYTMPVDGVFASFLNIIAKPSGVNKLLFSVDGPLFYNLVSNVFWDRLEREWSVWQWNFLVIHLEVGLVYLAAKKKVVVCECDCGECGSSPVLIIALSTTSTGVSSVQYKHEQAISTPSLTAFQRLYLWCQCCNVGAATCYIRHRVMLLGVLLQPLSKWCSKIGP